MGALFFLSLQNSPAPLSFPIHAGAPNVSHYLQVQVMLKALLLFTFNDRPFLSRPFRYSQTQGLVVTRLGPHTPGSPMKGLKLEL